VVVWYYLLRIEGWLFLEEWQWGSGRGVLRRIVEIEWAV
jgi:hypothetical protein